MEEVVDARDVLDANAITRRGFRARLLGHFERMGPDPWDPYRFVRAEGDTLDVLPGLRVQVETEGAVFRMRRAGRVLRAEWQPAADDGVAPGDDPRARFEACCVTEQRNAPGHGFEGAIAKSLRR